MSNRPSEHGVFRRSINDGNDSDSEPPKGSNSSTNEASRPLAGIRSATSPSVRQSESTGRLFELPPLAQTRTSGSGSFSPTAARISGVSSILNPAQAEESQSGLRRKASQLESPASSVQSLPPITTGIPAPQASTAQPAPSPDTQYGRPAEYQHRRILTPRSPSLHRAASLGQLNPSTGTINAQKAPFPSSPRARTYMIEPGTSGAPPLPTPPAATRAGYGFPATPSEAARRASIGTGRPRGGSSSASPSTSYSSYSQAGQTSPAIHYAPLSMDNQSGAYTASGDGSISGPGTASAPPSTVGPDVKRSMSIPISSSGGQNVYQMMTLETTSGTVQLPVDVQAASRVADEKRRRNAGASARFRQRRKEKEKEASTTISRLEQQVKELNEDVVFYRSERDAMVAQIRTLPGGNQYLPREESPRRRRPSALSLSGQSMSRNTGYQVAHEELPRSPESGRNVRRRTTTDFSFLPPPPPPPQPQSQGSGVAIQPNYGPLPPQPPLQQSLARGPLPPASQIASGQPPQQTQQQSQAGPPQVMQALPQTGPWNPYASERRQSGPPGQPPRDGR